MSIPENFNFDCTGEIDGSAHPHPDSCDFWFLCAGGRAFPQACGSNAKFDVNQARCVSESFAGLTCSTDVLMKNQIPGVRQFLNRVGNRIRDQI